MTKTALITGAASGIGYELSLLLAADAYNLILIDIDMVKLMAVKTTISNRYKCQIKCIQKDLSKKEAAAAVFSEIGDTPVDVLIMATGI